MEEKEESQSFKVVDKRRFSADGSESADTESTASGHDAGVSSVQSEGSVSETSTGKVSPEESSVKEQQAEKVSQEINFSAFLMGVYTQTLIFLGDIPNPETNLVSVNLEAAKQNIAVLSVIEEKTKGNLTPEEEHLFKEILTTVRLQFVKKT
jgi:hypothetical protein